jgi:membrane protein implicated in regulation of membrane protease activity
MMGRLLRWTIFLAFVAVLVVGGVNRTTAVLQPEDGSETQGEGYAFGSQIVRATALDEVKGQVASVTAGTLTLDTAERGRLVVEGQSWGFAQAQGFGAKAGDQITIRGFDEAGEFKAGQLTNTTSGQTVALRDESGNPFWSGRNQR